MTMRAAYVSIENLVVCMNLDHLIQRRLYTWEKIHDLILSICSSSTSMGDVLCVKKQLGERS
jgi:hypothetical protein